MSGALPTSRHWAASLCLLLAAGACGSATGTQDANGDGTVVVACLGDSNTDRRWPPPGTPKWCELAAERVPAWRFVNHAVSATTVTRNDEPPGWSGPQLDAALASDVPDAVVLAFGTNDVR